VEEQKKLAVSKITLGRYDEPDEFGRAVAFCCPIQQSTSQVPLSKLTADRFAVSYDWATSTLGQCRWYRNDRTSLERCDPDWGWKIEDL